MNTEVTIGMHTSTLADPFLVSCGMSPCLMEGRGATPAAGKIAMSLRIVDILDSQGTVVDQNALGSSVTTTFLTTVFLMENVWLHLTTCSMSTMMWLFSLTPSLTAHRKSLHQALLHLPAR